MTRDKARFLASERALWASRGIAPSDRRVPLRSGPTIRIQELGDGPPVVFVHGAAVAGASWIDLAVGLRDDFRCILVDRPGCGLSDPVPHGPLRNPADYKSFADRLLPDLLDALALDTAHAVSTSMGGFFAFRAVMTEPGRFTKLVEMSWPMGSPMARVPLMMRVGAIGPLKAMTSRMPITRSVLRAMLKQVGMKRAIETGTFDDDNLDWCLALLAHTDTLGSETANNSFISWRGENPDYLFTDAELQRVDIPVLLLWGDEDPNGTRAEAEAFAARLPDARLEMVARAGHAPWIDERSLCTERTRSFLLG
ncbi:MAG: alpha/beta hydrolase [Acidimicrobiales bacterium]